MSRGRSRKSIALPGLPKRVGWVDTSSWGRSDVERSVPKEWTLGTGKARLVIHHFAGYSPEIWFATVRVCGAEIVNRRELSGRDPEEAKKEALVLARSVLTSALADLQEAP